MITAVGARDDGDDDKFFTLPEVAEILETTVRRVYALIREDELQGCQVGARNQLRVASGDLRQYLKRNH